MSTGAVGVPSLGPERIQSNHHAISLPQRSRAATASRGVSALAGKLALVTGASGEIGSAIARRLARDGASILAHYGTNPAGAAAVVQAIVGAGGEAAAIGADLSRPDGAAAVIAQLDAAFGGRFAGRLDVLVNNAGTFTFGSIVEAQDDEFDRTFAINVRAPFQLGREAARRMIAGGWGRIVNVGSVFGQATPVPGMSVYGATKFALAGLTRAWARDLGAAGITVNAVQPALIQADPFPLDGPAVAAKERFASVGRFGRGDDVAEAVAYLTSPAASYITGVCLNVDGGWSA
jgi:3-oxoacyl-[acyl-carrier protein] reductase